MINSKAYFKLTSRRNDYEEELQVFGNQISKLIEEAKKLKKGSSERKDLMDKAMNIRQSEECKNLRIRIEELNYSINIYFYN